MGARLRFADVLLSKLTDVPPPAAPGRPDTRVASPCWVHRLEPLRVVPASFLHSRYVLPSSAASEAGGIPVETAQVPSRGGSRASSVAQPALDAPSRTTPMRSQRERLAIQLLARLGAPLTVSASDDEVRTAYRMLLRESHPDMHPDATASERDRHVTRLRAIVRAWALFQGRPSSDLAA